MELEFRGDPIRGLNLLTSYASIQAQVTRSTEYPVGAGLPNAPRDSGAIPATPEGMLRHCGVIAGVAPAALEDNFYNTALLPGYARLDLGAYYDFSTGERQKTRLSLNVQNALNQANYLASNGLDEIRPCSPFSALASLWWTCR